MEIQDLDKPNPLSGSGDSRLWLAFPGLIAPEELNFEDVRKRLSSQNYGFYRIPGNIYDQNPDFPNQDQLTIIKLIKVPEAWNSAHISVRLGIISDRDKAYLNGKFIGAMGEFGSPQPQAYDRIRVYKIPTKYLIPGEINTLGIQMESYFPDEIGINQDKMEIGPAEWVEGELIKAEYFKVLLLMIYFSVGSYFMFLFIRRRKDSENLFFSLFTFALVLYQFLRTQVKYETGLDFFTLKKLEYLVIVTLVPFVFHFQRIYFGFSYNIIFKILDSILGFIFFFFLFTNDVILYNLVNKNFLQPSWGIYIGGSFFFLVRRTREKNWDAIILLFSFVLLVISVVLDILSNRNIILFPRTVGYSFIFLVLSMATILANKFVRLNSEVEELNADLEQKVIDRTETLNQALEEVKKLKVQQDGDYFLTQLLLNPLISNRTKSDKIQIRFYTKQKKSFEFRGKQSEIGGDISIAENIELRGKKYVVFINGDAMGKSMQGAGGAIVLGVVFNAMLSRTGTSSNKHPEIWIKETFLDLQRVFESFNGSMLISIALGLIEEETGVMYYVNAEHPWTVLYRDGKASFLENELLLRKLGVPENEESFFIRIFTLSDGDRIFAGSDGRDDLLIGRSIDGNRMINEDETLFLRMVQDNKGDLDLIVKNLPAYGDLTDDLSIVSVTYSSPDSVSGSELIKSESSNYLSGREKFRREEYDLAIDDLQKSIRERESNPDETYFLMGQAFFKQKMWKQAIAAFENAFQLNPTITDLLFYCGYSYKMLGELKKAYEYSERCRLRDPQNIKNLLNLADIFAKSRQKEKAIQIAKRVREMDPSNKASQIFLDRLSPG